MCSAGIWKLAMTKIKLHPKSLRMTMGRQKRVGDKVSRVLEVLPTVLSRGEECFGFPDLLLHPFAGQGEPRMMALQGFQTPVEKFCLIHFFF